MDARSGGLMERLGGQVKVKCEERTWWQGGGKPIRSRVGGHKRPESM